MKVLDRAWLNCLRMWEWISENLPDGFSESSSTMKETAINRLKRQWLWENKFTNPLPNDCFFCAYDKKYGNTCASCPARLVREEFHCANPPHHFAYNPVVFYHHITKLDLRRRSRERNS